MEVEKLTRVFGEKGVITKKTVQRYEYDWDKVKSFLSPIGKWEEVLKADETKLRRVMKEIPENIRNGITEARTVSKEYTVLTASSQRLPQAAEN